MKTLSQQIAEQQNLTLLKIYSGYRLLLSIALLGSFFIFEENRIVGNVKPVLFLYASLAYLIINCISILSILPKQKNLSKQSLFVTFFIDIVAIIAIADSTGGIKSGLEILLVVIVAGSSIMLTGQIATLLTALASLFMLADTYRLIEQTHLSSSSVFHTGILGFVLFGTNFFIQTLVQRIRKSQLQAEVNAVEAQRQQQLNQLIVQRMQTGIVVCDSQGFISTLNQSAKELLLDRDNTTESLYELPPALKSQLKHWLHSPQQRLPSFKINNSSIDIQANFSALNSEEEILIFLENNQKLSARAQEIKLASLGRLTASIAHEIRNPLSAISHSAQLLKESPQLDEGDKKLSHIIEKHCKRVNQVIENVLQVSRRSTPTPDTLSLQDWLRQFIEDYKNTKPNCSIELISPSEACLTTVDFSQLQQVLTNLIDNGLRYSLQHTGQATLRLFLDIDSVNQLPYLDIIDEGEGINEQQHSHLFEPFYTTEAQGTGLGLFIAREMCEANQIRIHYLFNNQQKSCFRLHFPHHQKRIESNSTSKERQG